MSIGEVKVGDVVRLNSGGIPMTVAQMNEDGTVALHWFEEQGGSWKLQRQVYPVVCLKIVKEGE